MSRMLDHRHSPRRQARHGHLVTSVAFSPDSRTLASGGWDGTIKLWEVRDGALWRRRTLRAAWDEVDALAFNPDGRALAAIGSGWDDNPFGALMVWEPRSRRARPLARTAYKLNALAFSPCGARLATACGDRTVRTWDATSGKLLHQSPRHRWPVWSVAFSPDGALLASGAGAAPATAVREDGDPPGEIRLWDPTSAAPDAGTILNGHAYGVAAIAFSPTATTLATGGFDGAAKLWGPETGREWATLTGHEGWIASVAFSPDGTLLATGGHDHTIRLWDAATGAALITLRGHDGPVQTVAFSPDGRWLASGGQDEALRLWDVARMTTT